MKKKGLEFVFIYQLQDMIFRILEDYDCGIYNITYIYIYDIYIYIPGSSSLGAFHG